MNNNKEALYKYKCRRCGETYEGGISGENLALLNIFKILSGKRLEGIQLKLVDVHILCKNGGYGISDFIGVDIVDTMVPKKERK